MKTFLSLLLILPYLASGAHIGCIQCPKEDGLYSNPTKYESYVECAQGVAYFHDCPPGLIFLKNEKQCGLQKTKNLLLPPRFAGIKLTSCPKMTGAEPYYSSSTTSSGACSRGCSAYEGFVTSPDMHSVCRVEGGETCQNFILDHGLSADYGSDITNAHNVLRNELAGGESQSSSIGKLPTAANMVELIFNGELAKVAQAWTDLCSPGHDCYDCRKITSDSSAMIGQNGFFLYNYDIVPPDPTMVVEAWFNELDDLTSSDVLDNFNGEAGHFTQVIWANTSQVGCGWTVETPATSGDWYSHYLYCNYNYAGNLLNSPVYERGPPATDCPFSKEAQLQGKDLTKNLESKNKGQKAFSYLCSPSSVEDPCE